MSLKSKGILCLALLVSCSRPAEDPNLQDTALETIAEETSAPDTPLVDMEIHSIKLNPLGETSLVKTTLQKPDVRKNNVEWFRWMMKELVQPSTPTIPRLFPIDIQVYAVFLKENTLYVDLSKNIRNSLFTDIATEQLALEAFLASIKANFPLAHQVKILVEHEDAEVILGHTYAKQPFTL